MRNRDDPQGGPSAGFVLGLDNLNRIHLHILKLCNRCSYFAPNRQVSPFSSSMIKPNPTLRTFGRTLRHLNWLLLRESARATKAIHSISISICASSQLTRTVPALFQSLSLQAIHRFESAAAAVEDITALQDGRITPSLQTFLTNSISSGPSSSSAADTSTASTKKSKKSKSDSKLPDSLIQKLIVSDPKLGSTIKSLLKIDVVSDRASTEELFRGIRGQLAGLLGGVEEKDLGTMRLGLGHSLSR